ncbi:MAG: hypothetical protein WBA37_10515, partial [Xanthobacteraceae bacterium]
MTFDLGRATCPIVRSKCEFRVRRKALSCKADFQLARGGRPVYNPPIRGRTAAASFFWELKTMSERWTP